MTMIEESGENWYYISDGAPSIEVTTAVTTHEQWSKAKKRKKAKRKKRKPAQFGFGRALPKPRKR